MRSDLRTWRAMSANSLPRWIAFLVTVGGLAGLFSWLLVFAAGLVFDTSTPTGTALLWAVPRGALFAIILGFALRWYWNRNRAEVGQDEES